MSQTKKQKMFICRECGEEDLEVHANIVTAIHGNLKFKIKLCSRCYDEITLNQEENTREF